MNDGATRPDQGGHIHRLRDGAIGWLRIDNGARLNAMSLSMWHDLGEGVAQWGADPSIGVIVIAGQGNAAFCSGGDISEFSAQRDGEKAAERYDAAGKAALDRLEGEAKPTIAMIEGYCIGGGVAIALCCDLRIAADTAKLGIPAAKRGLSYDFASIRRLTNLVGPSQAKHILYTGRPYSAAESLRFGLVNDVVGAEDVESHVRSLAASIAANAPLSISASKLIVNMAMRDERDRDLALCAAAERVCLSSEDYAEASRAFMEKRQPIFVGR